MGGWGANEALTEAHREKGVGAERERRSHGDGEVGREEVCREREDLRGRKGG